MHLLSTKNTLHQLWLLHNFAGGHTTNINAARLCLLFGFRTVMFHRIHHETRDRAAHCMEEPWRTGPFQYVQLASSHFLQLQAPVCCKVQHQTHSLNFPFSTACRTMLLLDDDVN